MRNTIAAFILIITGGFGLITADALAAPSCKTAHVTAAKSVFQDQADGVIKSINLKRLIKDFDSLTVKELKKPALTEEQSEAYYEYAENFWAWGEKYDRAGSFAQMTYSTVMYRPINILMRSPGYKIPSEAPSFYGALDTSRMSAKKVEEAEYNYHIYYYNKVMERSPLVPLNTILFRGMNLETKDIPKPGQVMKNPNFISTSLDPAVSHIFTDYQIPNSRNVYMILVNKNKDLRATPMHSDRYGLYEITLQPNTQFKVLKVKKDGNSTIIYAEII